MGATLAQIQADHRASVDDPMIVFFSRGQGHFNRTERRTVRVLKTGGGSGKE